MAKERPQHNWADKVFAGIRWIAATFVVIGFGGFVVLFHAVLQFCKNYSYNRDFYGFSPAYILWSTRQVNVLAAVAAIVVLLPLAGLSARKLFFTPTRRRVTTIALALTTLCLISATLGCVHSIVYYWRPVLYAIDHDISSEYAESVRNELRNAIEAVSERKHEADALARDLQGRIDTVIALERRAGHFRRDDYLVMYTGQIEFNGEPLSVELKRGLTVSTMELHHGDRFFCMSGVSGREAGIANEIYDEFFAPIYSSPRVLPLSHLPIMLEFQSQLCADLAEQFRAEQHNSLDAILPWHLFALDTIGSSLSISSGNFKPRRALSRAFLLIHGAFILCVISALAQKASASTPLDPNRDYPYLVKHLATKLGIRSYDASALIWRLALKGKTDYHLEINAGKSPVNKYSQAALERLKEELEGCVDRVKFIKTINAEYRAQTIA